MPVYILVLVLETPHTYGNGKAGFGACEYCSAIRRMSITDGVGIDRQVDKWVSLVRPIHKQVP